MCNLIKNEHCDQWSRTLKLSYSPITVYTSAEDYDTFKLLKIP